MEPSEIESFLAKFRCLWLSGQEAQLTMNTRNGNAWITLSLGLGYPQPPPQYSPLTPQYQPTRPSRRKSKNSPARKRRLAKRLANRTAATTEAEKASTQNQGSPAQNENETKNAAVQVVLPTLSRNVADAAEQADLPRQVDVIDELCYDHDYQQYQAAEAYPTYSPSPCLDIPQLDGALDAVSYHHREEVEKRAKERAEDLQEITNMLNNII